MEKIELKVLGQARSESAPDHFALILEELRKGRRLPIIIGPFEAQAIAVFLERMQPRRPLTHDLFKTTLDAGGIKLTEILIHDVVEGAFHAKMTGIKADGRPLEVDARSSDAIAMAVRFDCRIFTIEAIMATSGIILDSPSKAFTNKRGKLTDYSMEELEVLLIQVLAKEDYESAAKIRNAIEEKRR